MRHHQVRGRPAPWPPATTPAERLADPIASARRICDVLPDAVAQAEAAGLSLIAQHLGKALHLARRVAASGANATS